MENQEKIKKCYQSAANYPDLAKKLSEIGITSYTVDTASSIIWYRFDNGEKFVEPGNSQARLISDNFDEIGTIEAIRRNQQGKSSYSEFMDDIAGAGVRFYEATLSGSRKSVAYIGIGGVYEEIIPW